jgi:hypothetical protein
MLSHLVFENLRSLRCLVLRVEPIFWTTWDSLPGFCSSAAARQSFLQFSESSVKREFIKAPLRPDFTVAAHYERRAAVWRHLFPSRPGALPKERRS